jgi:hypothetical protein
MLSRGQFMLAIMLSISWFILAIMLYTWKIYYRRISPDAMCNSVHAGQYAIQMVELFQMGQHTH